MTVSHGRNVYVMLDNIFGDVYSFRIPYNFLYSLCKCMDHSFDLLNVKYLVQRYESTNSSPTTTHFDMIVISK